MGEAKRRGSKPPSDVEKGRRWIMRTWMLYPKWFRTYYKISLQTNGVVVLVLGGVVLLATIAWLIERLLHIRG